MTYFHIQAKADNSDRTYYSLAGQVAGRVANLDMNGQQFATVDEAEMFLAKRGLKVAISEWAYPSAGQSPGAATQIWYIELKNNMRLGHGFILCKCRGEIKNIEYQGVNHPGNIATVLETLSVKRGALTASEKNYLKIAAGDIRTLAKAAGVTIR